MNARLFFVLLVSLYVCFGVRGQGDSTDNLLQINAIYPSGEEVASGERITLEFNQDMVSLIPSVFADEVVPIEIEPTLDCDWVWIESNSLKCDLPDDTDLMDATKYEVTVRPEFSSLLGQVMVEQFEHTFITKLPVIVSSKLRSWMSPTQPIIEVEFDQDINLRSAQDNILLIEKSSLEEFPVKVWPYSRDLRYSLNKDKYGRMQTYKKLVESDEPNNVELNTDRVLLLPERPLPDGINVSLVLLPGIEGAYGNVATNNRTIVDTEITTLGEFQLLGLVCEGVDGEDILIAPGQSDDSACDASSNFAIVFSSPIDRSIERLIKTDPDARQIDRSDWPLMSSLGLDEDYPPEFFGYKYWFRSDFKPGTDYQLYVGPKTVTVNQSDSDPRVQDGFDRSLIGTNVITFRTAHSSPKIVLERSWIVVDSNSSFDPRLYARNVEDVVVTYDLFDKEGEQRNLTLAKASPNLDDILHSQNLGLRSALRSSSGFMFGSISGRPRFDHVEESVADYFDVLATPYSILVKVRDFSALVWVVDLHTGEPVSNAEVKLFQGDVSDYSDTLEPIASGLTDANGLITFQTRQSTNPDWLFSKRYSIRVEGKEGIAMMPVIDDFEYQEEYFSDPKDVNIEQWITTLQPLYEPGDTVHIKGYIRDISESNLEIPDGVDFALCIDGGDLRVHQDVTLNQFGSFHLSHKLNEYSSFGIYDVRLVFSQTRPINDACSYLYREENYDTPGVHVASGGSFEVYEFETNPVQISLELNSETFQRGDRMSIVTSSQYFDGKPNAQGTGSVEIDLMPGPPPIKTVDVTEYEFSGTQLSPTESSMFERRSEFDIVLNDEGKHTLTYVSLNDDCYYGTFRIESSVNSSEDDHVATRTMAGYYGVDQFVGIRQPVDSLETRYEEWTVEKIKANKPWPVEVLVVSKEDEIVAGKNVHITVHSRGQKLSYSDYQWHQIFECELVSDMEPVACDFIPPETGHYRIDANIVDTKGYPHQSSVLVEAVTITEWALEVGEQSKLGDLKLNCDAQVVKVGDLVRCSVENSLSTAPTLVTIEHNGVIDHWLVRLDPTNPVIEFNIREEYVPNFTLSVLNQNPLDSKNDLDTALARISNTKFKVEHPYYEQLKIAMSSNRESYRVGDQVTLSISAEQGSEVVPIEYTVAVLDETLLNFVSALEDEDNFVDFPVLHELLPAAKDTANRYFDPTKKLWHAIESGVHTLGLLSAFRNQSVVPKTPPETRYQPSFVTRINPLGKYPGLRWNPSDIPDPRLQEVKNWAAYWNPSIISPDGQTKFNFELPNELTRWKVMVAAVSKDHRFGYGTTTLTPKASDIQSNVNIRAVQPNVVTEGDTFQVGASIENRTERKRRFTVELRASGLLATESETRRRRSIEVAPFETKTVSLDVKAIALASNQSRLNDQTEIRVVGSVRGRGIKDELDMRIPVRSSRVRVSKVTYGTLDDSETSVPIEFPRDNTIMDRQIDLTLTSIDKVNLNGVFRTASEEPYSHWEQRLSQAVLAMQYLYLENRGVNHGVLLFEPDGLVTQMLASMPYFQASDGGMVYSRSRYSSSVSPYLSAYSALALSWLDNAGFDVPQETNQKLTAYIQDFLKNESDDEWVDPADEDEELINSLHAITGAVMLRSMALAKNLKEADLAKYSDRIEQMDLFGMSQFLLATLELDSSHSLNDEIMKRIMRHLSSENGTVSILESVPETFAQIHHSNTRTLCSVLEALTKYAQSNSDGIDVGLLTELANSVRIARNGSTRWANSQENVFCTNALITYFDHAESEIRNLYATVDLYIDENQEFIRLADRWEVKKDFTQLHTKHPLQGQRLTPQSILKIIRQGSGTAFYDVEMSYLANLKQEVHRYSGFEIHREYVVSREEGWVILEPGDHINKGDTVLVNIFLNNKFDRYHVVLEDPVPGGLEPVDFEEFWGYRESLFNSTSEFEDILPTSQWYEDFKYDVSRGWVGELGLQKVQFFEDFLRRNKYQAAWIGRAITTGEFSVLPAHVEEMYRPIMYGKSRPWILKVEP